MLDIISHELVSIVFCFIKADYSGHVEMLEYLYIIFGSIAASLKLVDVIKRSHKSYEFTGNNPIKIAIFNSFVQLVFLDIECFEFIPVELNSVL